MDICNGPEPLASLRYVHLGGEVFYPSTLAQARELVPNATLPNLYGPTETSVYSSAWICNEHDGVSALPLGR
jgi:non-ribosomal peptide synthetase component F